MCDKDDGNFTRELTGVKHDLICRSYETVPHLTEGLLDYDELSLDTQPDAQEVEIIPSTADGRLLENNCVTQLI